MKLLSTFGMFYCRLVRSIMFTVLFIVMNWSSSFSAEKAENGDIAVQQILACVTVHLCMYVLISENNIRVACCGACWWLEALTTNVPRKPISKLAPCLPAHVSFGPGGVP